MNEGHWLRRWTLQWLWWGRLPKLVLWTWPRPGTHARKVVGKPLFYGLHLGVFEFRLFDKTWGNRPDVYYEGADS